MSNQSRFNHSLDCGARVTFSDCHSNTVEVQLRGPILHNDGHVYYDSPDGNIRLTAQHPFNQLSQCHRQQIMNNPGPNPMHLQQLRMQQREAERRRAAMTPNTQARGLPFYPMPVAGFYLPRLSENYFNISLGGMRQPAFAEGEFYGRFAAHLHMPHLPTHTGGNYPTARDEQAPMSEARKAAILHNLRILDQCSSRRKARDIDTEDKCAICVSFFKVDCRMRVLRCYHKYHKSCIEMWAADSLSCPLCRTGINPDDRDIGDEDTVENGGPGENQNNGSSVTQNEHDYAATEEDDRASSETTGYQSEASPNIDGYRTRSVSSDGESPMETMNMIRQPTYETTYYSDEQPASSQEEDDSDSADESGSDVEFVDIKYSRLSRGYILDPNVIVID